MTIQSSGAIGTSEVSQQLNGVGVYTSQVSTSDNSVKRLVKKTSGITFPSDFYGKGWGTQMNAITTTGHNQGDASNMRPYLMDRRADGGKGNAPSTSDSYLDTSRSFYGGCYMRNQQNSSTLAPRELAWNGYFYIHNPYSMGQFNLNGKVNYDATWQYGPGGCRTSFNLIGFSAGYQSGNRKNLSTPSKNGTSSGVLNAYNYYDSSYRHIVCNLAQWQDGGAGTSYVYFWDGWAS